jgi:hypothetical protein
MVSVIVVVALATLAVTIRQALDDSLSSSSSDGSSNTTLFDTIHNIHVYKTTNNSTGNTTTNSTNGEITLYAQITDTTNNWEFLVAYGIELTLNYFIYYPVVAVLLFSGIIGCGRTKLCGGRPYEISHNNNNNNNNNNNQLDDLEVATTPEQSIKTKTKKNNKK